uniref:Uncharacterized protein n=1 Tax=Dunaliella tertiolecta TaxID=3047 RepID=A0A7S3RAN2_DUNTE
MVLSSEVTHLTAYELERLHRIESNQAKLRELGVQQASNELTQALAKRKREPALKIKGIDKAQVATRQSKRLRGEATGTLQGVESDVEDETQHPPKRPVVKEVSIPIMAEAALYQKNVYRVSTMSDAAMMRRIKAITNISKMQSLVDVLQQLGSPVAIQQMAREKLGQLTS